MPWPVAVLIGVVLGILGAVGWFAWFFRDVMR